jgi:hypothetical protein
MIKPRFSQWYATNEKIKQDKEFQKLFPLVLESYILQNLYEDLEPGLLKALRDVYLSILREKVASNLSPEEIEPIEIYEGFIKRLTRLT